LRLHSKLPGFDAAKQTTESRKRLAEKFKTEGIQNR